MLNSTALTTADLPQDGKRDVDHIDTNGGNWNTTVDHDEIERWNLKK